MPTPRPASPFLILLFGAAATALCAEWLRFGWGAIAALPPLLVGGAATVLGVHRTFCARRRWRRLRDASAAVGAPDVAGPVRIADGTEAGLAYAGPQPAPAAHAPAGSAAAPPRPATAVATIAPTPEATDLPAPERARATRAPTAGVPAPARVSAPGRALHEEARVASPVGARTR